ncbi:MAG: hypothetical protein CMB82_01760 [Flammeovirgaceae bacterium]|nr:hypothetical protein [Flammeovirgaceae bacterium]
MRVAITIFIFCAINIIVRAQESYTRQKITPNISMKISDYFQIMPPQQLLDRYASSRIPIAMFTTLDGGADLGINETATQWGPNDIEILLEFYKASIVNLYTEINFVQSNIITVNERQFIVFEFLGEVADESLLGGVNSIKKYNYIQYALYNGKVLLFNFNCAANEQQKWQLVAKEMMSSIRLK